MSSTIEIYAEGTETPKLIDTVEMPADAFAFGLTMSVGTLWDRLSDDEWDQVNGAMAREHVRLRRLWETPSHVMNEGDNLWTVIAGHLDGIVSPERKAELLSRPGAFAAFADEAMAA